MENQVETEKTGEEVEEEAIDEGEEEEEMGQDQV
jgi:hypothetical protein